MNKQSITRKFLYSDSRLDTRLNSAYIQIHSPNKLPRMKLSHIKPISYLKSHTAELFRHLGEQREPMVITQNGEAKAVIQDVQSYQQTQATLALLKILALGNQQIESGKVHAAKDVIKRIRAQRKSA